MNPVLNMDYSEDFSNERKKLGGEDDGAALLPVLSLTCHKAHLHRGFGLWTISCAGQELA